MEKPFVLAWALLAAAELQTAGWPENRKIATGFFPGVPDRQADSSNGVEGPINWHLLVEDAVDPEVRMPSPNTAGGIRAANSSPKPAIVAHKPVFSRIVCGRES